MTIHTNCLVKLKLSFVNQAHRMTRFQWDILKDRVSLEYGNIVVSYIREAQNDEGFCGGIVYIKFESDLEVKETSYDVNGQELKLEIISHHLCGSEKKVKTLLAFLVALAILVISAKAFYINNETPFPPLSNIRKLFFSIFRTAAVKKLFRLFWSQVLNKFF